MSARNDECLFCRIVAGELPADKLYEDEDILAFKDIHPQAPFHGLIIPKAHVPTLNDLSVEQVPLAGRLFMVAQTLAKQHALPGYRVVVNTNSEGGQVIFHVHMHMLGGRQMKGSLG